MDWIRLHPYFSALGSAMVLVVMGALIVHTRTAVAPSGAEISAWGGNIPLLNPTYTPQSPAEPNQNIIAQVQSGAPYTYAPPSFAPITNTSGSGSSDAFNYDAFIAMLSAGSKGADMSSGTSGDITAAYSFIPSGLITTAAPSSARTALQQALYDYGNEVGSYIQTFEQQYPDEAQILKDQIEDRADPNKAAAVVALGSALAGIGESMQNMDAVPPPVSSLHAALAKSYLTIGKNLALVPQAPRDADFISAIEAYDASADTFVKNFVALATSFSAYGVKFAPNDPGSAFMFTPVTL